MKKIKLLLIVVVCLVLFGIRILVTYHTITKGKNAGSESTYSEIESKDTKYLKEDGQVIKVDEYIFTLEKYYFEEDINIGHCLISIMQEDKKGKDISCELDNPIMEKNKTISGYKLNSEKYYIDYLCNPEPGTGGTTCTPIKKVSNKGNKKYIYFDFEVNINGFENMIVIKDYTNKEDRFISDMGNVGAFKLEDNTDWREFTDGQNRINICHYGVEINDGQETNISDFVINMKDGSKHSIKKEDMQEVTFKYKSEITQLRFNKCINIDNISYIVWNGNKCSATKDSDVE